MIVCERLSDLRQARARLANPLGLVPTMGYLHQGHLSLVERARQECPCVAVSIFVNPSQFAPQEDLAAYPRDLPRDLAMLETAGVDLVWSPSPQVVYPTGYQTWVTVERVSSGLEGEQRPGHFRGVATIVTKLFHAFQPQRAYFGQKDAQQAAVIRRLAADLDFPVEVVVCPTVRESDGLALSSRNAYLDPAERHVLAQEPLAKVQYVSAADPDSLDEIHGAAEQVLLSIAVFIGKTRLIDNLVVGGE